MPFFYTFTSLETLQMLLPQASQVPAQQVKSEAPPELELLLVLVPVLLVLVPMLVVVLVAVVAVVPLVLLLTPLRTLHALGRAATALERQDV